MPINSSNNIQEFIDRFNRIETEGLSEKEIFQRILSIVRDMRCLDMMNVNNADIETISRTLEKKGCVDYKTWKEIKYIEGKTIVTESILKTVESGSIIAGAEMVGRFIKERPNDIKYGVTRLLQQCTPDNKPFIECWLENSYKYNEDLCLKTVSESERTPERIEKEKNVKEKLEQKRRLIKEIEDTEKLIKQLQEKLLNDKEKLAHWNNTIQL